MKSTYSGSGNCVDVEIKTVSGVTRVAVSDTKDGFSGPEVWFNAEEWQAFIDGEKAGEFDLPTAS